MSERQEKDSHWLDSAPTHGLSAMHHRWPKDGDLSWGFRLPVRFPR
jgi:hypothetical protein